MSWISNRTETDTVPTSSLAGIVNVPTVAPLCTTSAIVAVDPATCSVPATDRSVAAVQDRVALRVAGQDRSIADVDRPFHGVERLRHGDRELSDSARLPSRHPRGDECRPPAEPTIAEDAVDATSLELSP